MKTLILLGFLSILPLSSNARTPLEVSGIFTDHMVMQRRVKGPVWGWAEPGSEITVNIGGQLKKSTTAPNGKWRIDLDPMETGEPRRMTISSSTESIEITDILLGEVWLCSGQSNMEWHLANSKDAAKETAAADFPSIRLFNMTKDGGNVRSTSGPAEKLPTYPEKLKLPPESWQPCTPETAAKFSAVAYYFGRELHNHFQCPIGLISNPVGGTAIQSWISRDAFLADPDFKSLPEHYDRLVAFGKTEPGKAEIASLSADYEARQAKLKAAGKWPLWPAHYKGPGERDSFSSVWFNTRVNPLIPFAIRGIIWYQGEANTYNGGEYSSLLPILIRDWRSRWAQPTLPFIFVQLPGWSKPLPELASGGGWALVREAQLMTLKLPETGMAVAIDVGDREAMHPLNKQPVGERLSLSARAIAYGEKIVYSGPIYRGMKIEGGSIRLSFDHIGGGLEAKGGDLTQFAIAGADGKFVAAKAVIDKDTIVVSAPELSNPTAVRYGWQTNPEGCNLYNKEGLPASPFRTDEEIFPPAEFYKKQLSKPPTLRPGK